MTASEHYTFACKLHGFEVTAFRSGRLDSSESPRHRSLGCEICDAAISEAVAFAWGEWP